jgi:UDP-glucose 4-epimerase
MEPAYANLSRLEGMDVSIHRADLSDFDTVKAIVKECSIDAVVHLVSTLIPGSSYEDYKEEFKNVIFPSIELMELCSENGIKFIYFSSGGTVYGNCSEFRLFKEDDDMAPISYYGWSKQMMENSILFCHRTSGLDYLIVRPSNPYGHGQNIHNKQGLIAVAIGKLLEKESVEVWGDGAAIRDYIYIDDLADIFCQLLEKNVCNETLNIGSGRGYSVNDVLAFLKIVSKSDYKIEYKNSRSSDVSNMILDTSKLNRFVTPHYTPIMEGISKFYTEELNKKIKN